MLNIEASLQNTLKVLEDNKKLLQNTFLTLKAFKEEFEEIEPSHESNKGVVNTTSNSLITLVNKINEELKEVNEKLRNANTLLSQYQDYNAIQQLPEDFDKRAWEQANW